MVNNNKISEFKSKNIPSALPGQDQRLPESNSEVPTIRPLLYVYYGYPKALFT